MTHTASVSYDLTESTVLPRGEFRGANSDTMAPPVLSHHESPDRSRSPRNHQLPLQKGQDTPQQQNGDCCVCVCVALGQESHVVVCFTTTMEYVSSAYFVHSPVQSLSHRSRTTLRVLHAVQDVYVVGDVVYRTTPAS